MSEQVKEEYFEEEYIEEEASEEEYVEEEASEEEYVEEDAAEEEYVEEDAAEEEYVDEVADGFTGDVDGSEEYTEVTSESWFSRLGDAAKGFFIGLLLVVLAVVMLFWNEGRTVKRYKALKEGRGAVVSISSETCNNENDGKLVHLSGITKAISQVSDHSYGIAYDGLMLKRNIEMYQWQESTEQKKKKTVGGTEKTVTVYKYKKVWQSYRIDSSDFKRADKYRNPADMLVKSQLFVADTVKLGGFTLSKNQVERVGGWNKLPVKAVDTSLVKNATVVDGVIFVGKDPLKPMIGDIRVSFEGVPEQKITVVARQSMGSFEPYPTKTGAIDLLQKGTVSVENMFGTAEGANGIVKWIIRIVGIVLMFYGFKLVFNPLVVIGDVVPFIGSVLNVGTGIVSFVLTLALSLFIISIAWLFYRPLIAVPLLGISAGSIVFLKFKAKNNQ